MLLHKRSGRLLPFYGLMFFFIFINQQTFPLLAKSQFTQWSPPQTIPLYNLETLPPILIADQNRTVHAFSSQWKQDQSGEAYRAIVYNQWSHDQGWTLPVDIIISPNKEARVTDAFLDANGTFHVIFFGGDHNGADIYYTEAPASIADDARAWSAPVIIGENANDPESAVIAKDDQGSLYVVYYGKELGSGLYVVNSKDDGITWSDASPIFLTQTDEPNISHLHVIQSKSGSLHALWNVNNVGGQGRGIYYARSSDGIDWSEPVLLADAQDGLGTQTPTIIEYNQTLFVIYNMTPKITMRQSFDDGQTWQDPIILFPRHVGVNGSLSLVVDGNNALHLFFGQRISGNPDIHGMWHSMLVNNHWTEPEAVIKGPRVVDTTGLGSFDPYDAHAIVSQGNVILVTWRTDPGGIGDIKANGVWFSSTVIDAPELPVATLQPFINDAASPLPTQLVNPTSSVNDLSQIPFDKNREIQLPTGWIYVGVIAISLLGGAYIFSRRGRG